jgi:glutathione peroxidase
VVEAGTFVKILPETMEKTSMRIAPSIIAFTLAVTSQMAVADSNALLGHELRRLHSPEVVRLDRYAGQPLLIVNTASHCGFTRQFKGLEAVHQQYADKGLKVLGFSSDDFNQEAKDEAKAAEVCFVNFGVTFDMFATIPVKGEGAHPLFRELARQSSTSTWSIATARSWRCSRARSSPTSGSCERPSNACCKAYAGTAGSPRGLRGVACAPIIGANLARLCSHLRWPHRLTRAGRGWQ